jgi:RNA polymerase sigma factor (TIGR02999 family)
MKIGTLQIEAGPVTDLLRGAERLFMNERTGNVTELLARVEESDPAAREALFELVYDELRQLASGIMARERPGHTLDCTGLVNEAAARLLGHEDVQMGSCRAHFFATMVQAMRRVLVEHARRRNRLRREGSHQRVPLDETLERLEREQQIDVLDLDEALTAFRAVAPRECQAIELRFFGGLPLEQIAQQLEVSEATVKRDLRFARLWLHRRLSESKVAE